MLREVGPVVLHAVILCIEPAGTPVTAAGSCWGYAVCGHILFAAFSKSSSVKGYYLMAILKDAYDFFLGILDVFAGAE